MHSSDDENCETIVLLSFEEVKEVVEVEESIHRYAGSFSLANHSNHVNDANTVNRESLYLHHLRDFE
jgi:hypothetical protein